jgi:hypothetical protein
MIDTLSRMIRTGILTETLPPLKAASPQVDGLQMDLRKILGRALCIRHVDAGSCNGCELEIQALNNPYYNLEGVGIKFVASPRHADLLLVTGPVSANMETYSGCRTGSEVCRCGGRLRRMRRSVWNQLRQQRRRRERHSRPSHGNRLSAQSRSDLGSHSLSNCRGLVCLHLERSLPDGDGGLHTEEEVESCPLFLSPRRD